MNDLMILMKVTFLKSLKKGSKGGVEGGNRRMRSRGIGKKLRHAMRGILIAFENYTHCKLGRIRRLAIK